MLLLDHSIAGQEEMASQEIRRPPQTSRGVRKATYSLDAPFSVTTLQEIVRQSGRDVSKEGQYDLMRSYGSKDEYIYYAGNVGILSNPVVSIVGTREVSEDGRRRATRLARELGRTGIVIMSGLAKGVDTAAHLGALDVHGMTAAVIGTPLQKAYPIENAELQSRIARDHVLISPFPEGDTVYRSNFPKRNRVMALLSDATIIVEASNTSGTIHQAVECLKSGRWLFLLRSLVDNPNITWPSRFMNDKRTVVVSQIEDIVDRLKK